VPLLPPVSFFLHEEKTAKPDNTTISNLNFIYSVSVFSFTIIINKYGGTDSKIPSGNLLTAGLTISYNV